MTSSNIKRLIICDVTRDIAGEEDFKYSIKKKLPQLSGLNVYYDRTLHKSIFVDYCVDTKHLEVVGHCNNYGKIGQAHVVSFLKEIEPSTDTSVKYVVRWIQQLDADYSNPKTESYDVF